MIEVDEGICEKLGKRLKDVQVLPQEFLAEDFDEPSSRASRLSSTKSQAEGLNRTAWMEEQRRKEQSPFTHRVHRSGYSSPRGWHP